MGVVLSIEKDGRRHRYVRTDTNEKGKVVLKRTCELEVVQTTTRDNRVVFSLLDENGNTNILFHKYINERMVEDRRSVNSRRKSAQVLCKFLSFTNLMGYSEYALGLDELYELRSFLQGSGRTESSNETVNAYLGIIRNFFRASKIPCEPLFSQHIMSQSEYKESDFRVDNTIYQYDLNLPMNPHKEERVPKYISMDQYIKLQKLAQAARNWVAVILMHLMFRYGMRLGECLGLTEEDLVVMRIKGTDVPTLIVRNRLSDRPWQHAKRKIIPRKESDYEGISYQDQWRNDDYAHYGLTESGEFVDAFQKFIRTTREDAERNFPENYRTCEADIVCPEDFTEKGLEKNHYIFVNRLGKRLSAQLWGLMLKDLFTKAEIKLDVGRKDKNLSHRFRHGFAMMHARFMDPPVPPQELQKMMHHRNLSSTMIYYNPTPEDEYEYKTAMQNKFYDTNPELNKIISQFLNDDNNENNDTAAVPVDEQ